MPNNIASLSSINLLFADYIQNLLGLNVDQVLISYSSVGQKSSSFGSNVVYVYVTKENDSRDQAKMREVNELEDSVQITSYTMRTLKLALVFYGTDTDVLATQVEQSFYQQAGKLFLEQNNMSLVSERTFFNAKSPELINERWWDRTDLHMYFYNSISVEEETDYIAELDLHTSFN